MNPCNSKSLHAIALAICVLAVPACGQQPETPTAVESQQPVDGVTLTPEQIEKLGITTIPAQTLTDTAEIEGYGVVLNHEPIAQLTAELATAEAAARQSRAVRKRTRNLAGTPGAFSAENRENAERQADTDAAALSLARNKLTATLGRQVGGPGGDTASLLGAIASGKTRLVHVTFPLGSSLEVPPQLRLARLDADPARQSWIAATVWSAPADAAIPGRSYFALLTGNDIAVGEHLRAWMTSGAAETGVFIPASAVVITENAYWCYVEAPSGKFTRRAIDTGRPVANGYFVKTGVTSGDNIVTTAAGLLLARETNPAAEAD